MFRFWETCTGPLIDALAPQTIVEIGAFAGEHTRLLLDATPPGSVVHSIDPEPAFDVDAWAMEHGDRFVFHRAPSLTALADLPAADLVLVDGDHNWFTVLHELHALEDAAGERFPVVLLHDVGWPYGRRDLYYAPERIPPADRHPTGRGGIVPGTSELVEVGGLNAGLWHAVHEGGPRNGVLTAIEDFLAETDRDLDFFDLPGLFGLGILFPRSLADASPATAGLLSALRPGPALRSHLEALEWWRVLGELDRASTSPP